MMRGTAWFSIILSVASPAFAYDLNDPLYELVEESRELSRRRLATTQASTAQAGGDSAHDSARSLHFYALGDVPYLPREWRALPTQISNLHPLADFAMHVGDLKKRSSPCVEEQYLQFRNIISQSLIPVFNTIGDNDVVDCANSTEAYAIWKSTFAALHDQNWTNKPLQVARQEERPENFVFWHNGVFVISLHIVHASFADDPWMFSVVDDTLEWLESHRASMQQAEAIVMFAHMFPFHPKYASVRHALESIVQSIPATPILFIQGEEHHFQIDNPIQQADNFLRVIVDKGGIADPLEVLVDPKAQVPFKLKRRSLIGVS